MNTTGRRLRTALRDFAHGIHTANAIRHGVKPTPAQEVVWITHSPARIGPCEARK
jgi:hypothetical protein